ncbi:MAG: GNAT family N-acetyltransferase [Caldilineaceae bacterium SB0675_bin_29]|uniref:GNAT family N-acetyltransferase n=1 Tax=Caldilineaceae bacterium SB0675_bin_29 TaxID=2605266 RepID=A0A6B1FYG6_9CHLR|nr:GNAT family N-acetyltransferase [Caldilineaceae bacterium SB0675_bin_29]
MPPSGNKRHLSVLKTCHYGIGPGTPSFRIMNNTSLIEALRSNYIEYFRLFHNQHGIRVHVDQETAWIVANGPPGNHILRTNLPSADTEESIDALLSRISSQTGGIRWLLFPQDRPGDLRDRLKRRGLITGRGDLWMFRQLQHLPQSRPPSSLSISPVRDLPDLRAWWTASALGFGTSQRAAQRWYDAFRRNGLGRRPHVTNYVGKIDKTVVTTATLILTAGIAGIYDISTPPQYRGNGFATALVNGLLTQARSQGHAYAGLQTGDAEQFYQSLGFNTGFQEEEFFWAADQPGS